MSVPPASPNEPADRFGRPPTGWRLRLFTVIFEADTRSGRLFDLALVWLILASVAVVMLDSFASVHARWGGVFSILEWVFTVLFSLEYLARLACVQRPGRYAGSVFGVIDLLAVLPTWAALVVPGLHALIDVRALRLLRLFRILKLAAYIAEYRALGEALMASRRKILVFLSFVLLVTVVMGSLMYAVEGPGNGFDNIPVSIYWAISTMTTVGFGDITPKTGLGRLIASIMMLVGWGTLAVPTGIVSAEFTALRFRSPHPPTTRTCPACLTEGHAFSARYCSDCGAALPDNRS
ncbi:ion transporter [Rhizobacter sp. OV335]|uniref:ion transporter n=1 Tax=Rhizobacter sp. OV335 TaxID=1500264 RepID=UPI00091CAA52|nr:ion transporter [Rhizobacter sp. OV335]SHM41818.1 voltage-gated potassium channel [Rhizobacter sp. OV335]